MKKETFKEILSLMKKSSDTALAFCEILDTMIDGRFVPKYEEPLTKCVMLLIEEIYGVEAVDWFSWYIWETDWGKDKKMLHATDNGNPICRNDTELWEYMEKLKKMKEHK